MYAYIYTYIYIHISIHIEREGYKEIVCERKRY